jgi:hypothetical protein
MIDVVTGGRLDKGARGGTGTTKLKNENIHFPSPLRGVSTVYVHNYNQFGTTADHWCLEIHLGDYVLLASDTLANGEMSPKYKFRYDGPHRLYCRGVRLTKKRSFRFCI